MKRVDAFVYLLAAVAPFGLYIRTTTFGFVDFDDFQYVVYNPYVSNGLSASSLAWAMTSFYASNWHPLTWLSHMIDVEMFGMAPAGHHLINVLLHTINTVLVCRLFVALTGRAWESFGVAVLFGVHPLHVESVAYIAERKDLLSTLFWLLTTLSYVAHRRSRRSVDWLTPIFFAAGLMSKPMLVTLPLTLLILDYWPLERVRSGHARAWRPLVVEKLPLFVMALLTAVVTLIAQRRWDAVGSGLLVSLFDNLPNIVFSYAAYLRLTMWPAGLSPFYPWPESTPAWQLMASLVALTALSIVALRCRRRSPWMLAGWLWYLVTLAPVIGIVRVGSQGMADRYTYVPLIGIFAAMVWTFSRVTARFEWRRPVIGVVSAFAIALLCVATWRQVGYWRDGVTLFERALAVAPDNPLSRHNLGVALVNHGRPREAIDQFKEALRQQPDYPSAYLNLGHAYLNAGEPAEAAAAYREALRVAPGDAVATQWLRVALRRLPPP